MKRFRAITGISILMYIVIAVGAGFWITNLEDEQEYAYRIEINRIMQEMQEQTNVETISLTEMEYVKKVEYLDHIDVQKEEGKTFFLDNQRESIQIKPLYKNHTLQGYLKFTYLQPWRDTESLVWMIEGLLLLLECFVIAVLLYLHRHIVKPFQQLLVLPSQLSNEHYHSAVIIEKNNYLKQYLWEMSQLKDHLESSKKRQIELLKEKKQLLLLISHDIKTPINIIKLYVKALQNDLLTADNKQQALTQINRKADEIDQYVDKIIRTSREDIFDLEVEQKDFYLHELIDRVNTTYRKKCEMHSINFEICQYKDRLCSGDIDRAQEILDNLFENALKYGDGKQIKISCYEEDYCLLIRMFNTGSTIADHEVVHIFDSFYRASNAQGKQGSGLGLYICKELMRKMNGDIFAQKEQEGMAFILVFH